MVKRKGIILCLVLLLLLAQLSGCAVVSDKPEEYDTTADVKQIASAMLVENEKYTLSWNADLYSVFLNEKSSGMVWSSVPQEFTQGAAIDGRQKIYLQSPLYIDYYDVESNRSTRLLGYNGAIRKGRIASEAIDNGIQVTYYFDEVGIVVPIKYTLNQDGMSVCIDPKQIEEHDMPLLSVAVSPFMCSASNDVEGAYLVIPSGSGALMYTDERAESSSRSFSGEIYGEDATREKKSSKSYVESVRLPVFGACSGDRGIMAVVEDGAEQASIEAESGNSDIGYSSAFVTFNVRGYDQQYIKTTQQFTSLLTKLADGLSDTLLSVRYMPLSSKQATYQGIAKQYGNYLMKNETVSNNDYRLNVTMLGGTMIGQSFLGISYNGLQSLTTATQATAILEDCSLAVDGHNMSAVLKGYTKSGVDVGLPGGGFSFASALGNRQQQSVLQKTAVQKNCSLYYDYDLVRFSKSGSGVRIKSGAAKTVTGLRAFQYPISYNLQCWNEKSSPFYLVGRKQLYSLSSKLLKCSENLPGISLSTLSEIAYSDYQSSDYFARQNMSEDVTAIFEQIEEAGHQTVASRANAYAAVASGRIIDVPQTSSRADGLDVDIPFYQLVFSGRKAMAGSYINTSTDPRRAFLLSLEMGNALNFITIGQYDSSLIYKTEYPFYGMEYDGISEEIKAFCREASPVYDAINGSAVQSHKLLTADVHETVFENGTRLIINFGTESYFSDMGEVENMSFIWKAGEGK